VVQSNCASAYRNTWMDGWIDRSNPLELELSTTCGCQWIQMRPCEGHWKLPEGCFCCYCRPFPVCKLDWPNIEFGGLFLQTSKALFQSFQSISYYRFRRLLASLGPPASCCGDPGLKAGLFSGFLASALRSVISKLNLQGMQFSGDHTRIESSFGFKESFSCLIPSGVLMRTLWRFDCSSRTVTPFPLDSGASTPTSMTHLHCLSLLLQDGSESLVDASVSPFPGITLMSTQLPSLLSSAWTSILILLMLHWKE